MTAHPILHRTANAIRMAVITIGADRLVAKGLLFSRLRPDNALYPKPTIRKIANNGIQLRLDLSDYVQWLAYFRVEADLHERLFDLARPGDTVFDIGSNIGQVLLNLASRVGREGRAIGFEPNPATYALCVGNLALNLGLKAEVHPVALGDAEGELNFGRPCASNSGGDRIMAAGEGAIQVPVTTLDRFAVGASFARVDLIKIDVEGFELHVLRGAEQVIARFRPILFVELSDDNLRAQGGTAADLVEWLKQHGYAVEEAGSGRPVSSDQRLDGCFFDVICRPC